MRAVGGREPAVTAEMQAGNRGRLWSGLGSLGGEVRQGAWAWCARGGHTGRPAVGSPVFQCLKMAGNIVCSLPVVGCWGAFFPIPFGLKWVLLREARPFGLDSPLCVI